MGTTGDGDGRVGAFVAVDLGASSGRVIRGEVTEDEEPRVVLTEVTRFPNGAAADADGTLRWDLPTLHAAILAGLRAAAELGPIASIGVDTWAVDYGLLDDDGALLADPVAYRDSRTEAAVARVHERVPAAELYAISGMQHLPFNTVFQLDAERHGPWWDRAATVLLVPDLLAYLLTGARVAERTNASTTGLLDVGTGDWSAELLERLDLDRSLLPDVVAPGTVIGTVTADAAARAGHPGLLGVPVVAVGSHDTASAVVGVPADGARFAYLSCGTWSLVGVELDAPIRTEAGRAKNFTNELGVDGTVRYLRNVMGLWLLQECQRVWSEQGSPVELSVLLAEAAEVEPLRTVIDVDHPDLLPPGDMPARIAAHARDGGQPVPGTPAEVARTIIDSLAIGYRRAVRDAVALSGRPVDVLHIVGGGVRNTLLMRLTADATGLPVVAGPEESTALGNVLVQARAAGAIDDAGLAGLRAVGRRGLHLTEYAPDPAAEAAWAAAEGRVHPD